MVSILCIFHERSAAEVLWSENRVCASHGTTVAGGSGEAMAHGLVSKALVSELFLVVALTMALTPFLAELGARLGKAFESSDFKVRVRALLRAPTCTGVALCEVAGAAFMLRVAQSLQRLGRAPPCTANGEAYMFWKRLSRPSLMIFSPAYLACRPLFNHFGSLRVLQLRTDWRRTHLPVWHCA